MTVYGDMLVSEDDASFYASVELEVTARDVQIIAVTDDEGNERNDLWNEAGDSLAAGAWDSLIHDAIDDERAARAEDARDAVLETLQ